MKTLLHFCIAMVPAAIAFAIVTGRYLRQAEECSFWRYTGKYYASDLVTMIGMGLIFFAESLR